jgi:hypothetical protein
VSRTDVSSALRGSERIIVEVMGDEPPGGRWRPAAALAALVAVTQTAHALDGTFMLSSPPDTLHISGNLTGSTISFGAVGVVTFTGTLSGSTLSGSYTDIANGKTGSWTVTLSA